MSSIKQTSSGLKISDFEDKTLLIVDDDDSFRNRLSRAMEKKGFEVKDAIQNTWAVLNKHLQV